MTLDVFLLILRLLLIVLLYLFLMQVVIAITRDLGKTSAVKEFGTGKGNPILGHLVVVDSGPSQQIKPGASYNLMSQNTIGRGPTSDILLPETFISGEHTRMWYRNGNWYVQDAGSTNGTYLNSEPAREPLTARIGDIVQVGYIRFKLAP
ncbi:MAG TPA: FHA domain-containing protein [Ktedonobacteraceae bacterium]|nr:FHA domain-containing protein [Ktedonobacteraceae bacterium]